MHARVHSSGDEGLDLQALPGQGMLVVSIAIVRSDAPSVPEGGTGQVLHGVFSPKEDVAPKKLARAAEVSRRARAASVRASYSAMMD